METAWTSTTAVPAPVAQDGKAVILAAIAQSKTSLLARISHLAEECNFIWVDLDKIWGTITETENHISTTEDLTATYTSTLADLHRTVDVLLAKSNDAKNRLRCNNVRVLGLPEEDGDAPAEFAESSFLLGFTEVSATYVVERAHCMPSGCFIPGNNQGDKCLHGPGN